MSHPRTQLKELPQFSGWAVIASLVNLGLACALLITIWMEPGPDLVPPMLGCLTIGSYLLLTQGYVALARWLGRAHRSARETKGDDRP